MHGKAPGGKKHGGGGNPGRRDTGSWTWSPASIDGAAKRQYVCQVKYTGIQSPRCIDWIMQLKVHRRTPAANTVGPEMGKVVEIAQS